MTQTTATRNVTFRQAFNEAIRQEMERDQTIFVMGEDVAGAAGRAHLGFIDHFGGSFALTKGLIQQFGPERIRDTPISEAGFIGAGVGAAATGLRPIVDLMFVGFVGVCADQIINNAAKMHYMFGGKVKVPLTILAATGAGHGSAAQHSETLYALFAHIPGLKCVGPSNPYSAKGLLTAAIRDDDPVVVFSNISLMGLRDDEEVPEEPFEFPIGRARVRREGSDLTLVGIGATTPSCLEAADDLEARGYSAEVVDLLSVSPIDEETVLASVRKTRKIVITDEDYPHCSVASEISARVAEQAFDYLDAPPKRVMAPHAPVPYSPPLESAYLVSRERIFEAALTLLE